MVSPYIVRPVRSCDFDALWAMAVESGPGFTSLPVDETILRKRIDVSLQSFKGQLDKPERGKYLMMLENTETGDVGGCCAVKAGIGMQAPFFNYRIITLAQASHEADRRFDMDALILTNEFAGFTEVGTLFLRKAHRGGGVGRLLAQARYLLMAAQPERFADTVIAELRGVVSDEGETPFWDELGRHFFRMSFAEADYLSATTDNQFILDLMPKYPIYVDLLAPEARKVLGQCHPEGVPASKLLQWEGFRFEKVIDIFDGGPIMQVPRPMIRTIRQSCIVRLETGHADEQSGIMARTDLAGYRASLVSGFVRGDDRFVTSAETLEKLELKSGDTARIWLRT